MDILWEDFWNESPVTELFTHFFSAESDFARREYVFVGACSHVENE